jgi:hypothetical protein
MNVSQCGVVYSLARLPLEGDGQLAQRKQFIFHGDDTPLAELDRRTRLSKYWHNIVFRGCRYADEVHALVDAVSRGRAPKETACSKPPVASRPLQAARVATRPRCDVPKGAAFQPPGRGGRPTAPLQHSSVAQMTPRSAVP